MNDITQQGVVEPATMAPPYIHFRPGGKYDGMDLRRYSLRTENVEGASFDSCNMEGMDLFNCNLNRCSFRYANMTRVLLRDASLYGCDIVCTTGLVGGITRSDGHIFYAVMGFDELMIKAGCRWYPMSKANVHWLYSEETIAILRCLEALAAARGYRK